MKKNALVTGGNSGIGYATARLLKKKGYEVYISGRNLDRIRQAADELGVGSIVADMADPEDITRLASNFSESGLDVLVNNAGTPKFVPVSDFTLEDFSRVFDTNVRGPLSKGAVDAFTLWSAKLRFVCIKPRTRRNLALQSEAGIFNVWVMRGIL